MKGIILAGGHGTRLLPLTRLNNKHLLPVYDRLMIEYPLQTLIELGCDDILIVTGGEHVGDFANYLGDGSSYGVRLTYRVQPEAGGIAQALGCAEGFVNNHQCFPVILGDNYFSNLKLSPEYLVPTLFVKKVENPQRFGVVTKQGDIVEKPEKPETNNAVTGLYIYNSKVFPQIRNLTPSKRGELEITDINNWFLKNENAQIREYQGYWSDMGTHDSLNEVANYVKEQKNG